MALSLVTMRDFYGPDFGSYQWSMTLHSDNVPACTRVQPELACARRQAVAFAFHKMRAKHNLAQGCIDHVDAVVWNLELTCWLIWASFQFTPRSWTSSIPLIFLANILCVHVRKSDQMYASPTWCTHAKKKRDRSDRVWHLCIDFTERSLHCAGATHVLTVVLAKGIISQLCRCFVNVMHFWG